MQEGIFFVTNIHKYGIEPGHELFDLAEVHVTYGKLPLPTLVV